MRIAIPYVKDGGQIGEQFDSAENVKLYNLEGDRIVSELVIPSFCRGLDPMLELLKAAKADILICGGITGEARQALAVSGVMSYPGFGGAADDAARAFASGSLQQAMSGECASCAENCDGNCPHHSHGEDGCGHRH